MSAFFILLARKGTRNFILITHTCLTHIQKAELWPRLPTWFWTPAGLWEIIAGYLLFTGGEYLDTALGLLFTFMGGVFSAVIYIKDEKGFTHFGARGGSGGRLFILPAIVWTALYVYVSVKSERSDMSTLMMVIYALVGFLWGVFCSSVGSASLKKE